MSAGRVRGCFRYFAGLGECLKVGLRAPPAPPWSRTRRVVPAADGRSALKYHDP